MIKLVVPAYFHPAVRPGDWDLLVEHADMVRLVVLNVASGPGAAPDEAFLPAVRRLTKAGVGVAGYVDTDYGRRPRADVLCDMARYTDWYGATGVFFDRVAAGRNELNHYASLSGAARGLGLTTVAFNHGTQPVEEYAHHADLLGTFEGPWPVYLDSAMPRWVRAYPPDRFFHLVFAVPPAHLTDALTLAGLRHTAAAFVTDQSGANPWLYLPPPLVAQSA